MKLFDREPAVFEFSGSPADGVRRLNAVVKRSMYDCYITGGLVGRISDTSVAIARHRPGVRNSFAPVFLGRFEGRGRATILTGEFTFSPFIRAFMPMWFVMFAIVAVAAMWAVISSNPTSTDAVFAVTSLSVAGLVGFGLTRITAPWADEDIAFIKSELEATLAGAS